MSDKSPIQWKTCQIHPETKALLDQLRIDIGPTRLGCLIPIYTLVDLALLEYRDNHTAKAKP